MILKVFILTLMSVSALCGCAAIVNDDHTPLSVAFSDGSSGKCVISNNRASYDILVPSTQMVRRARSDLNYSCITKNQETAVGSIPSSIEAEKLAASIIFLDFGIIDSITEKARTYPVDNTIYVFREKNKYDKGKLAFDEERYKAAFAVFKPLAVNGLVEAQNHLGLMYQQGKGTAKNYEKAMYWYRLAAEQKYPHAEFNIGIMYQFGYGVNQDFEKSAKWYKLSADQRFAAAWHNTT